ncbi:MAG: hypothetical protein HUJ97_07480 [Bacteroidales bacterium]|nr:hypothetical protein [Bacteroidales bacterium]
MKRTFALLALLFSFSVLSYGQKLQFLKNESRIKLVINYSEASIVGHNEDTILGFEEDWEIDQPILYSKLTEKFNGKMGNGLVAGEFKSSNYTMEVRPLIIKRSGYILAYFVILDNDGNEVYHSKDLKADGGILGTFLNLLGDGMRQLGIKMAKEVKKEMK